MAKSKGKYERRHAPFSREDFARQKGYKTPPDTILIVCEGRITEAIYFKDLIGSLGLMSVRVEGLGTNCRDVVAHAVKRKGDFDEVWCVLDTERPEDNTQFLPAVNKARENGLELAVSCPAFEYWYLLHFEETTRPFANASDVIAALKVYIRDYQKNESVLDRIYGSTAEAIARARRCLTLLESNDEFPNPSTSVYQIVETLLGMSATRNLQR